MRTPKPWYRAAKDAWFVELGGKQHRLASGRSNKAEATTAFHRLMATLPPREPTTTNRNITVAELFRDFIAARRPYLAAKTLMWYEDFLDDFQSTYGTRRARDIKGRHVEEWLNAHTGWKTARRCAVTAVKTVFNWAVKRGDFAISPLRDLKKDPPVARQCVLTAKQRTKIFAAIRDEGFRDFVVALQETGC